MPPPPAPRHLVSGRSGRHDSSVAASTQSWGDRASPPETQRRQSDEDEARTRRFGNGSPMPGGDAPTRDPAVARIARGVRLKLNGARGKGDGEVTGRIVERDSLGRDAP